MSSYLNIYIKKREVPVSEQKLCCILYYTTSVCTELKQNTLIQTTRVEKYSGKPLSEYEELYNDWVSYYAPLTLEIINDVITYYENEIIDLKKTKSKWEDKNTKIFETIKEAQNKEVVSVLLEEIENLEYYDEAIEELNYFKKDWEVLAKMYENIKYDDYEFVYTQE